MPYPLQGMTIVIQKSMTSLARECAVIQWDSDSSFSVIDCSAIQSGIEAVGESIVAMYGRKPYAGVIVELGKMRREHSVYCTSLAC